MMKSVLILLFIVLLPVIGFSQDSTESVIDSSIIRLTIENLDIPYDQTTETLTVYLDCPDIELGGIDLKIGIDSTYIKILDILPGDFITECRWELFRAKEVDFKHHLFYQFQLWQSIAIADMVGDTTKPSCFNKSERVSLMHIVLEKRDVYFAYPYEVPLFVIWEDCSDNSFSSKDGNKLFIAKNVLSSFEGINPLDQLMFPNNIGHISECVQSGKNDRLSHKVEFLNSQINLLPPVDSSK